MMRCVISLRRRWIGGRILLSYPKSSSIS